MANQYHVVREDAGKSAAKAVFKTISDAAAVAGPGDTVIVHEGTYRERVSPRYGGIDEYHRITYTAAEGEKVVIKGSEVISEWERFEGTTWKTIIPNTFFGDYNPYTEVLFGDWFMDQGRVHHTGEVYLNGRSFFEMDHLDAVLNPREWEYALDKGQSLYTWYCEQSGGSTVIYANFHEYDPRRELVEINVRPVCFYPRSTGVNYLTVRGFELCQAATPWAPPTAEQFGLIGPHWAKGWIIEDNIIHDAKCSGISLGKDQASGENEWSRLKVKHGTQRERDVIFKALRQGWSKEMIGSHVVRNNVIYDCGQTGICGHLGAVFSTITGNHIYNIHAKDLFTGHEMAGIKLHAPLDVLIRGNHIHHCTQGIWLDWQAQGARISANLLYENRWDDLFIEVSHGPYVVDNNIFLSPLSIKNVSQGGAYLHNLIGGRIQVMNVPNRFTPYHFAHSTEVAGLMTILCGDDRFYNNIFAPVAPDKEVQRQKIIIQPDENAEHSAKAQTIKPWSAAGCGLSVYDEFPLPGDRWYHGRTVDDYAAKKLPVYISGNVYFKESMPFAKEESPVLLLNSVMDLNLETENSSAVLQVGLNEPLAGSSCPLITSDFLGIAFQAEVPFEDSDGRELCVGTDYFGRPRGSHPVPGPFENLDPGICSLVVWPREEKS